MNIVCIGSGNVATHLAMAFKAMGAEIKQVWSPQFRHAERLAALTRSQPFSDWAELSPDADCYLIAVKDDAIAAVAGRLQQVKGIVVHTSGATPLKTLAGAGSGQGVLYPLQTFSRSKPVDLTRVPIGVEGDCSDTLEKVSAIAGLISPLVHPVNTAQRQVLHLSAVFACNFSNHLYALSSSLLSAQGLGFDLIRPLILETAEKVQYAEPREVQTGPAVRQDSQTMLRHLEQLKDQPGLQQIYEMLSDSIKKMYP